MSVHTLYIQNFRNLKTINLGLCAGINVIRGANGAGKTAILEALAVLVRGRSFRTARYQDCIAHGAPNFLVRAEVATAGTVVHRIGMQRHRSGQVDFRVDGEVTGRLSEGARLVPLQILLPTVSDMVFAGPGIRRQWLDWGVFHVEPQYLGLQREFGRLLKQRNAELRRLQIQPVDSMKALLIWSQQLAQRALEIDVYRRQHFEQIKALVPEILTRLNPAIAVELNWYPGWAEQEELAKVLVDGVANEVKSGTTRYGPHRADLVIKSSGHRATQELSRGQGKLVAIALILTQALVLRRTAGVQSVFLMDDIAAELDGQHREALFRLLIDMDSQVLATANEQGMIPLAGAQERQEFHVKHGELVG